jgi:alkylhydroperoxidase family enzyme
VQAVSSAHQLIDQLGFQSSDDAMLRYVVSLTVDPASMHSGEVQLLREAGFSELEVHDIVMVVACFSYMNRLADGTGVTVLEGRHELARELLGEAALRTHLRWSQGT